MTAVATRTFELTSTVTFHQVEREDLGSFALKLEDAVREVLSVYPAVEAFLVEADMDTGDVNYGLRFSGEEVDKLEEIADRILAQAVDFLASADGVNPIRAEREESLLVLTR